MNAKPPIWRRILVDPKMTMYQLHHAIQITMGWDNYHLYQFIMSDRRFIGDPQMIEWGEVLDAKKIKLGQVLQREKDKVVYEYDFGDGWQHQILLEKILPKEKDMQVPICIKGKRNCPPEDCGGVWGYENLCQALAYESHPEHEELLEWVGGEFDPEDFEIDEINGGLSDLKGYMKTYESYR